ncbi:3796_t:CDS:2 [Ambispora leptoticha]|uniref:3796_t:CDS:1 n=1 Tax=Ambispora leptoticha TaxID=144679 RepID=A0A9N9B7U8_9GLOM|nr:3796_t:CDS:2 [Ambispora leptoticha]
MELEAYHYEKHLFDAETFNKFKDPLSYWNHINGYTMELYKVAIRIFSIVVSSLEKKSIVKCWLELVENESFENDQDLLEPLNEVNTEDNNDFMNTLEQVQEGLHPADDNNTK